jgi:hypothetical protein
MLLWPRISWTSFKLAPLITDLRMYGGYAELGIIAIQLLHIARLLHQVLLLGCRLLQPTMPQRKADVRCFDITEKK